MWLLMPSYLIFHKDSEGFSPWLFYSAVLLQNMGSKTFLGRCLLWNLKSAQEQNDFNYKRNKLINPWMFLMSFYLHYQVPSQVSVLWHLESSSFCVFQAKKPNACPNVWKEWDSLLRGNWWQCKVIQWPPLVIAQKINEITGAAHVQNVHNNMWCKSLFCCLSEGE